MLLLLFGRTTVTGTGSASWGGWTASGAGTVTPAPTITTGAIRGLGWRGLLNAARAAGAEQQAELARAPVACPLCGEKLDQRAGVWHCPLGHWQSGETPEPVGVGDWGGLAGVLNAARADAARGPEPRDRDWYLWPPN